MPKKPVDKADYILPLNINGLQGRMLRIPGTNRRKKREILFVYGHHTSLERVYGVAEFLSKYGTVTVPDLPGFGGMEPYYKIGKRPTLDNMADYLAAFIKLRYRNKRFIIGGYSLGVIIIIRMLQKYPEIAKKVDLFASISGFASKNDFVFSKFLFYTFRWGSSLFTHKLPAAFLKYIIFRRPFIRLGYYTFERFLIKDAHSKIRDASPEERKQRIDFEVYLWQCNDIRTYMEMAVTMFTLNLTGSHVDLPVYHVGIDSDRYFNNNLVEQHMREIFRDFQLIKCKATVHSPSVVATAKDAAPFVPPALRRVIRQT